MKIELKPCPFCGEEDSLKLWVDREADMLVPSGYLQVVCDATDGGCGASSGWRPLIDEAVVAWNTREKTGGHE